MVSDPQQPAQNRLSAIKAKIVEGLKKYGFAGLLAVVIDTVVFWIFLMIPSTAFLFHRTTGVWIPGRADTAVVSKIFGGVWLFCRLPPVEAARWAWKVWLVRWLGKRGDEERAVT